MSRRPMGQYPRWFFPAVMGVLTVLIASGALLIPDLLEMRLGWGSPVEVPGSVRLNGAAVHSFAGMLTMGVLGALWPLHGRGGLSRRRNHVSGIAMTVLVLALAVTAVAIYYLGDPDWSRTASAVHTLLGLVLAGVFAWHQVRGRRLRQQPGRACPQYQPLPETRAAPIR